MKEQLKKVFSDPSNFTGSIEGEQNIKVEPISIAEDLYYGSCYSKQCNPRFKGNIRYNFNNKDSGNQSSYLRKVYPHNRAGEINKFNVCGSIYHWTKFCPDSYENQIKNQGGNKHCSIRWMNGYIDRGNTKYDCFRFRMYKKSPK